VFAASGLIQISARGPGSAPTCQGNTIVLLEAVMTPIRFLPARHLLFAVAAMAGVFLSASAFARDGISCCTVQKVGTEFNASWRHTIHLQVPEGPRCRVYIWNDNPGSGWQYCWNKSTDHNPVVDTCHDLINEPAFNGWKVKAVCGDRTFTESCRRGR
jgi:hypothetical protein